MRSGVLAQPRPGTTLYLSHDIATTQIYTLSLHDALPIFIRRRPHRSWTTASSSRTSGLSGCSVANCSRRSMRSEEHTSELQSRRELVCRLLLEKKKLHSLRLHSCYCLAQLVNRPRWPGPH